ncbi:hypothetical protein DUT91_24970 [Phyllobacterium salinisoli]|uniref:Uncharacterized protein n=1 Tax=Phyllobacterium salinisoli TaxID=1899321 RepID=A0A368K038_9HYPH|nr:hypothetical protein DUT91_24970 [Phyllobacterium salinisoli]
MLTIISKAHWDAFTKAEEPRTQRVIQLWVTMVGLAKEMLATVTAVAIVLATRMAVLVGTETSVYSANNSTGHLQ